VAKVGTSKAGGTISQQAAVHPWLAVDTHVNKQTNKRNMLINLKIGFNNNLITSSSYTKFLDITMDCTLSWNDHIYS
jgi:hypothetical protein